ncbi:MAG: 2-oxoglutarate dehydrogenase [Candidatus Amoebophilus sp. 36-38]|nr:MAG: 2-oxoglutarate dehydrogenase [Candidatus Amoebophilus sp. 36-38]
MKELLIIMPKMGESIMEATISRWLKKEGDTVLEAESIVEVATDKVDSEIPTPYTGKIKRFLVQVGDMVAVGNPIAVIETEDIILGQDLTDATHVPDRPSSQVLISENPKQKIQQGILMDTVGSFPLQDLTGRFFSPLVRHIAQKESVSLEEMENIPGTGKDNRVTKQDLLAYLRHRKKTNHTYKTTTVDSIKKYAKPEDEIIPMDRVRKVIAERMVEAMRTVPHVTSFVEADVTNLVMWRDQFKGAFKEKTGIGLTYTPLFIQAVARTIRQFPLINISVVGEYIIKRKAINIGLAVALPDGNLIVPVVKNTDQLNLTQLAIRVNELVHNARHGQLLPDDIADGTYTISNIGSFQNLMGTPMIMQPQVAILAVGAIVKRPAVIETAQGDQIAIRHKMYLSHTYDHRVVDGSLGGQFVKSVADYLENFDVSKGIDEI